MHKDPVCGMEFSHENFTWEFKGERYFFCSQGCLGKFKTSPSELSGKDVFDLIIIGGGPAGLTAAVYASVSKIDTFFITDEIGGQAIDTSRIKNYMGFEFISGPELIRKFKDQFLKEHYLSHKIGRVVNIEHQDERFEITTLKQEKYKANAVIVASGMKKRKLGIPGENRLQRKGICYSLVHDIDLFKGSDVVVIGGGNSGVQTANDLQKAGCTVTLVTMGKMLADPKNIEQIKDNVKIIEGHIISEILGDERVKGVIIQSEKTNEEIRLQCSEVFIQVGFLPNTEFCCDLVNLNENGEITIHPDCSTRTEGLFACGDVTNTYKRIIIASGEGAKAALSVKKHLREKIKQKSKAEQK
jgi:NADH-dependent peroxiredoxin subunit F